jgi:hypothetical protein
MGSGLFHSMVLLGLLDGRADKIGGQANGMDQMTQNGLGKKNRYAL